MSVGVHVYLPEDSIGAADENEILRASADDKQDIAHSFQYDLVAGPCPRWLYHQSTVRGDQHGHEQVQRLGNTDLAQSVRCDRSQEIGRAVSVLTDNAKVTVALLITSRDHSVMPARTGIGQDPQQRLAAIIHQDITWPR